MASSHYSTIGAIVPVLVKKIMPYAGKLFGVAEIDEETKKKVRNPQYPKYYGALYALWMTVLFGVGLAPLFLVPYFGFINFPDKVPYLPQESGGLSHLNSCMIKSAREEA